MKIKMVRLRKHIQVLVILLALVCASTSARADEELSDAASDGDLSRVKTLIAAKADVNAKRLDGSTALMVASEKGHLEVVQVLITAKVDVNAKRTGGATALIMASQEGH
jgi:uncharacterized protein